jgi:hypothetical protein
MKFGFHPTEFERQTGLRAYNLAVPGTPPPLSRALLARALAAGARPRAIVFGHMTLGGEPRANLAVFSELLGPLECIELAQASQDSGLVAAILTRRLLPSLRYRESLQTSLLTRIGHQPPIRGATPGSMARALWDNWETHRGAESKVRDDRFDGRMEPALERTLYSKPWGVHPAFEGYMRRTAALAAAYDIPVFWVIAPIVPEAQARRDALGHDADHTRNLRAIVARTRNVTVLDARRSGFPASAFIDSCHLNNEGAACLTAAIARAVSEHLAHRPTTATPRWVELEPFERPLSRIATGPSGVERR